MVSSLGLLDGLTAAGIIISAITFGSISLYQGTKKQANLLKIAGLTMIFIGFLWLGPFADFLTLLFTGRNLNPIYLYGWLSYLWVGPVVITAMYIGTELIAPDRKKIILGIYTVFVIIFELFLFLDVSGTFIFELNNPGQDLIDGSLQRLSVPFFLMVFFQITAIIFLVIGFAIKAKQSVGEIRRKFAFLSLGFLIFALCSTLDTIVPPGIAIGFVRGVMMTFALWMYLGLKT
ncbi:MAG: hypothetical protein ACFFAO_20300 [Candidatus Hermodarchaeota archaeon]